MLTHHSVRWAHTRINLHWKCYQIHTSTHSKFTFGWATIENSEREKKKKNRKRKVENQMQTKFFQLRQLRSRARYDEVKSIHTCTLKTFHSHFELFLIFVKLLLVLVLLQSTSSKPWCTYVRYFKHFFSFSAHPLHFHRELHLHKHPIAFCKWEKKCKKKERKKPDGSHIIILLLISMMLMVVVDRWKSVKMHEKSIINYDGAHTATATTTKRYESEQKCIEKPKWLLLKMEKKLSAKSGFTVISRKPKCSFDICCLWFDVSHAMPCHAMYLRRIHTSA